jgi:AraC family transcriptional regulator, ethanolamine operon transcriptional activator
MSLLQPVPDQRGRSNGATSAAPHFQDRPASHDNLVLRVNAFIRDNLTEPVTTADLSRTAGVSERTLRAAFHDVLGISPKQYVIRQRLCAAHHDLAASDPQTTTVTDIATTYGFYELGRFAGRYRALFGERPSRTLHHVENVEKSA